MMTRRACARCCYRRRAMFRKPSELKYLAWFGAAFLVAAAALRIAPNDAWRIGILALSTVVFVALLSILGARD